MSSRGRAAIRRARELELAQLDLGELARGDFPLFFSLKPICLRRTSASERVSDPCREPLCTTYSSGNQQVSRARSCCGTAVESGSSSRCRAGCAGRRRACLPSLAVEHDRARLVAQRPGHAADERGLGPSRSARSGRSARPCAISRFTPESATKPTEGLRDVLDFQKGIHFLRNLFEKPHNPLRRSDDEQHQQHARPPARSSRSRSSPSRPCCRVPSRIAPTIGPSQLRHCRR